MAYDTNNVFAKILRGELPKVAVYEDDLTLAFMDIMPAIQGHTLVIPKEPCVTMFDCSPDGLAATIRTTQKIAAAVKNARAFLAVQEEYGSFDAYCWQFVDGRPRQNRWKTMRQIPATTRESDAFSRDLKRRGFSFVGSTVIYGHMQAVGMVNDHLIDCFRYRDVRRLGISGE